MVLDIIFLIIILVFFYVGKIRGFVLQFFHVFKYLLIMFFMNNSYIFVKKIFKLSEDNSIDQLKIYSITFIILNILLMIVIKIFDKFLKEIKLQKMNDLLGGIFGIIESTFIIFVIYVAIISVSTKNKEIKEIRNESYSIKGITQYAWRYSELFPEFVEKDVIKYKKRKKVEELKTSILKEIEEGNLNKEKDNNENNR